MIPARCSPRSRSTSVIGMRASRPIGTALILPSLTQRRTVSGCNPRRLATSPERNKRVFSVLITRIDYNKYVNPSTVVHPPMHEEMKAARSYLASQFQLLNIQHPPATLIVTGSSAPSLLTLARTAFKL